MKPFGKVIKRARRRQGLTLRDLAKESGIRRELLERLENGAVREATGAIVFVLADTLGLSVQDLAYRLAREEGWV